MSERASVSDERCDTLVSNVKSSSPPDSYPAVTDGTPARTYPSVRPRGGVAARLLRPVTNSLLRCIPGGRGLGGLEDLVLPADGADVVDGALLATAIQKLDGLGILGLHLVPAFAIGSLGFVDYYCMASATLREGLERLARCVAMFTETVDLSLEVQGDTARFVHRERRRPRLSANLSETFLAVVAERCRVGVGSAMVFREVHFIHAPSDTQTAVESFFGCPASYDAAEDALVFDARLLDTPLLTADPSVSLALAEQERSLASGSAQREALISLLRQTLAKAISSGVPPLAKVARSLGLSPRTLQRRLAELGTRLSEQLDEVRRELAMRLLQDRTQTLAAIASTLGFSEPAPFFRAFRRWTGTTPRAFRNAVARGALPSSFVPGSSPPPPSDAGLPPMRPPAHSEVRETLSSAPSSVSPSTLT